VAQFPVAPIYILNGKWFVAGTPNTMHDISEHGKKILSVHYE
jgi:hypothetical protein